MREEAGVRVGCKKSKPKIKKNKTFVFIYDIKVIIVFIE